MGSLVLKVERSDPKVESKDLKKTIQTKHLNLPMSRMHKWGIPYSSYSVWNSHKEPIKLEEHQLVRSNLQS